ncbi:nucleotide sugar dehydrogenase, partial [Alphaproteobacteria bacterium]|nr:nucleotide sugar dehydrogenase [Alphaproteobacteria bacterium]
EAGFKVVGFDTSTNRIKELTDAYDKTCEVENNRLDNPNITYTDNADDIEPANFHIITVPTPITSTNEPDISYLIAASQTVGKRLKAGDFVIYESTVYPGCTEDDCIPLLEAESKLTAGQDFYVGYSPERINPGDLNHRFETILKIVSAQCPHSLKVVADTYGAVVTAGIYQAASIKVAEAAKVIENTQRDLNIGFVNELSKIFNAMGVDTYDVLKAAGTKWNFNAFEPGLVGGHCISVDPYYLTSKALKIGAQPKIILSGRDTNNDYPAFLAEQCSAWLKQRGITSPKILQFGLTFKENVPDIRNSKAFDLANALRIIDPDLAVIDPVADIAHAKLDFRFNANIDGETFDTIVLAVPHQQFIRDGWQLINTLVHADRSTLVMDIKARLDRQSKPQTVDLWRP